MNKKRLLAVTIISVLLFSAVAGVRHVNSEAANLLPSLAMPEEYINYTITTINGSLWAKIDGTYPIHILLGPEQASDPLTLVYPTPPGTTNISVRMNETELSWDNYTKIYPEALHPTAIGDWPMINCTIYPIPEYFTLKIHYEHPIMLINGSYTFLYDLNISPYLSSYSNQSTAYFSICMETNYTNLRVNTVGSDEVLNSVSYAIQRDGTAETITFHIVSEYSKPLPGDILITFTYSKAPEVLELPYLILPIAVIATLIAIIAYRRKRSASTRMTNS